MPSQPLSTAHIADFHRDGYVILRNYFSADEMELLKRYAVGDHELHQHHRQVVDGSGRISKLTLWNYPGDDLYGMFARCRRVADGASQLLGEEAYHWHSKMMLKEPRVGEAWEWHQDYGY